MKKKIWFYLCIIQSSILASIIVINLWPSISTVHADKADIQEYVRQQEGHAWTSDAGYIPNAKVAKIVGSEIIDNITGNTRFGLSGVTVEYDKNTRLWKVSKGYLFHYGGIVVIEQDSGKVVTAQLTK